VVDVRTDAHAEVLTAWVATAGDDEMIVTVGQDGSGRRVRLDIGERLDLAWRGNEPGLLLGMPTELLEVTKTDDEEPAWRLRPLAPPSRLQRRDAVRAALSLPVVVRAGSAEASGRTVDVSEAGLRCAFPVSMSAADVAHQAAKGAPLDLRVDLGPQAITASARFVRERRQSTAVIDLSMAFVDLPERTGDLIRARVFRALREERVRSLR